VASWRRYASQLEALRPLIRESYGEVIGARASVFHGAR
jgi:hypothetical protein